MTGRAAGPAVEPVVAGVVTAVVGFTSSFAVVVAGLRAVGADARQAASGLFVLSLTMGVGCVVFAVATRRPVTMAWSTPGAALLVTAGRPDGGFAAAVGAFVVTGALLALTGLVPWLAALLARIPAGVASAMLAGVLLQLCVAPFHDLPRAPWEIATLLAVWALARALLPRWAVPLTLVALVVVLAASGSLTRLSLPGGVLPHLAWTTPHWSAAAMLSIALPLYLVTMTGQNVPGVAVMSGLGYQVPWRSSLAYTGAATAAGAGLGGHAINLAAISAALSAGPAAGADRSRRWLAAVTTGVGFVVLGCASPVVVAAAAAAPTGVVAAFAGIALLGAFAAALGQALTSAHEGASSMPAVITLVVAASGLTIAGIGAPFWALLAGCTVHVLDTRVARPAR